MDKRSTTAVVDEEETQVAEATTGETTPAAPDDEAELAQTPPAEIDEAPDPKADPADVAREKLASRARLLSDARVATICESLLFVADKPVTEKAVQDATGIAPARVRAAMEALAGHYREGVSGIVLHEVSGGFQLRTCPTSAEHVRRFLQVRPQRLTRAALETLSIVAYRQPVTRPEVEEIRGVDCGAVLKALLERGLLQVLGKKEEPGRPLLYGTTRAFLEFFNLKDLASLPTLREFHELNEEHQKIVEETYTADAGKKARGAILEGIEDVRIDEHRSDDEAALDDLDAAIAEADVHTKAAAAALAEPKREDEASEAGETAGEGEAAGGRSEEAST